MSSAITLYTPEGFELGQRMAKSLSSATLVPKEYQENLSNCMIALELAQRLGMSPLMVMQSVDVIHGRPSFRAQFVIAAVNATRRYEPLQFRLDGEGDDYGCVCWTRPTGGGDELAGPRVTIKMAKDEGWYGRTGSKWKTMPEVMLRYRSATFFGRLYAPEVLMGMLEEEEAHVAPERVATGRVVEDAPKGLPPKKVKELPAEQAKEPTPETPKPVFSAAGDAARAAIMGKLAALKWAEDEFCLTLESLNVIEAEPTNVAEITDADAIMIDRGWPAISAKVREKWEAEA